jgi:heme-degrading monooxygenase HmoA
MKKIFITNGTIDYLHQLRERYPSETMLLLSEGDGALLVHETDGETVFNEPRPYEVLDAAGELGGAFAVFNNIPVTDEGRPLFEHRFSQRARLIEKEPGFVAIRVLRPLKSDTYIIMTLWENETAFKNWQQSKAYEKAHQKRGTEEGSGQQPSIFPRPSYVTTYVIANEKE